MKWRKWGIVVAIAIGVYAIIGFLAVPPIAKSQIVKIAAKQLHRRATIDHLSFNPFLFKLVVGGFDLRDRDGSDLLNASPLGPPPAKTAPAARRTATAAPPSR